MTKYYVAFKCIKINSFNVENPYGIWLNTLIEAQGPRQALEIGKALLGTSTHWIECDATPHVESS